MDIITPTPSFFVDFSDCKKIAVPKYAYFKELWTNHLFTWEMLVSISEKSILLSFIWYI